MKFEETAKLLTAEAKPYSMNGNEGTSYKVRLNIEGEIFSCKSDAEQVASLKALEGSDGKAVIEITSRKENLALRLVSFVPQK